MTGGNSLISTVSVDKAVKKVRFSVEFKMLRGRANKRGNGLSYAPARLSAIEGGSES
jgi:hypothetical protein